MNKSSSNWLSILGAMLLMVFIQGCGGEGPPPAPKENVVLVYCDFTTSLKVNSATEVRQHGLQILDQLPVPFQARFYEINRVERPAFFTLSRRPESEFMDETDYQFYVDSLNLEASKFDTLIEIMRDRYTKNPDYQGANSCILNTLDHAYKRIKTDYNQDTSRYNFFVVLISDMIEECENSPVGKLYLRAKNSREVEASFADFKTKLEQNYQPSTDLSFAKPYVIQLTRPDQPNPIALRGTEFANLWRVAFRKAGFTQQNLERWNFSASGTTKNTWLP